MKKFFLTALVYLSIFLTPLLSGKIIEVAHFNQLANFITDDTLVLVDIDDTLLIPCQTLGTDAWFCERLKHYKTIECNHEIALDRALADWEGIRHLTKIKIVETGSEKIVDQLQKKNVTLMGLTTQGLALTTRTINQLLSLAIDLSKTAPTKKDYYFYNHQGILFRKGILFTSGSPKGEAVLLFLNLIDFHPKHIVFINDKATHLKDVETIVEEKGIRFTGLRYSYSDNRVSSYRSDIANIQWNHSSFNHILSDEEAEKLL